MPLPAAQEAAPSAAARGRSPAAVPARANCTEDASLSRCCANGLGAMAHHDRDGRRAQAPGVSITRSMRVAPAIGCSTFGTLGLHPSAFAGGENDDVEVRHSARVNLIRSERRFLTRSRASIHRFGGRSEAVARPRELTAFRPDEARHFLLFDQIKRAISSSVASATSVESCGARISTNSPLALGTELDSVATEV